MKTAYEIAWESFYDKSRTPYGVQLQTGLDSLILKKMFNKSILVKRGNLGYSEPTIDSVKDYEELISAFKRKIELLKEIIEDLKLGRPFHQKFEQNHNEMIEEKK